MASRKIAPPSPAQYSHWIIDRVMASAVGQIPVLGRITVRAPDAATAMRWRMAADTAIAALESFRAQLPRASAREHRGSRA